MKNKQGSSLNINIIYSCVDVVGKIVNLHEMLKTIQTI